MNIERLLIKPKSQFALKSDSIILLSHTNVYKKNFKHLINSIKLIQSILEVNNKRIKKEKNVLMEKNINRNVPEIINELGEQKEEIINDCINIEPDPIIEFNDHVSIDNFNDYSDVPVVDVAQLSECIELVDFKRKQLVTKKNSKKWNYHIFKQISDKLKEISKMHHAYSRIEVQRDETIADHGMNSIEDINNNDFFVENINQSLFDNLDIPYNSYVFFNSLISHKSVLERSELFFQLLLNIEKGNLIVEQSECYSNIQIMKMEIQI